MEHLLLKAATTATDDGTFTAVISAASVDREKDIVDPDGMVRALQKWVATGKKIPLAWQHSGAAEDQIGWIDPASAKAVDGEVVADGFIDQSTEVGAHAWRLVKAGTLGFSFGYLIPDGGATKRAGGGLHIKELDVFEITATPTPMHNSTRVLGWKADVPMEQLLNAMLGMAQKFIDQEDDPDDIATMRTIVAALKKLGAAEASEPDDSAEDAAKSIEFSPAVEDGADVTDKETKSRSVDPLRRQADAVALEFVSNGESRRKSPTHPKKTPKPELVPLVELKRRMREEMLTALSGGLNE